MFWLLPSVPPLGLSLHATDVLELLEASPQVLRIIAQAKWVTLSYLNTYNTSLACGRLAGASLTLSKPHL